MSAFWMLAASLAFAIMAVFTKLAAPAFSIGEVVFYRSLLTALFALPVMKWEGTSPRTPRYALHFNRSIWGIASLILWFYAIIHLALSTAQTLNLTSPIFLAMLLLARGEERWSLAAGGPILLGFAGVWLLLRPSFAAQQAVPALLGLMSGFIAALAYDALRKVVEEGEPETRVVFYFGIHGAVTGLVWMLMTQSFNSLLRIEGLYILGVGFFGMLGQLLVTRAYGRGNTLANAALSYSSIAFGASLAYGLWGETLSGIAWIGVLLICGAGVFTSINLVRTGKVTKDEALANE
jgi:drug/metabolite transporter (DMT)-like permease